jgi:hypothetical protein
MSIPNENLASVNHNRQRDDVPGVPIHRRPSGVKSASEAGGEVAQASYRDPLAKPPPK